VIWINAASHRSRIVENGRIGIAAKRWENDMTQEDWSAELTTHTGFAFRVRPARPEDEAALAGFFAQVTPDDLRFRFLSSIKEVGRDRIAAMTRVDHKQTENFLAFADGVPGIIATGMLACDAALETGEVAIVILPEHKHKGVSWELLRHIMRYAEAKGVKTLESLESRENRAAIELEKELGFVTQSYPDEPGLVLVRKDLR
jgi:GNAT superfamily N-acetyltransferase